MKEVLAIATSVATPLALLGLVAALAFYAYQRRLRNAEKTLELLPPDQRASNIDSYLTRYGIDGKGLTREQKFQLIKDEMDRRHRQASISKVLAAAVFLVCFVVAAFAYAFHGESSSHSANGTLSLQIERMKLANPSGLQLDSKAFTDKDRGKVVQEAAAWVAKTLREQFPQTGEPEFVVAVVSDSAGSGKTLKITPEN